MLSIHLDIFEAHRPTLIGLVYRITGSRADAEDIVQETFIKWLATDNHQVHSARAWLTKVATRMALDYIKSARVSRTSYIGPWLPEPFVEGGGASEQDISAVIGNVINDTAPDIALELDQSLSMALLVLLEALSPPERASFILHDLFHFDFKEIAEILQKTEAACRKLASRARARVGRNAVRPAPSTEEHIQMVTEFFNAVKNGDVTGLVGLLKESVELHSDGGGKAVASLKVLQGANTVAGFLLKSVRPDFMASDSSELTVSVSWFNGAPGLIVRDQLRPITAFNFELDACAIKKIYALRNPDKLRLFG